MDYKVVILFIIAFLDIIFGALILIKNFTKLINLFFALISFSLALWAIGLGFFIYTSNFDIAMIWAKVYYIAAVIIAFSMLNFAINYPTVSTRLSKVFLAYTIPTIIIILAIAFIPGYMLRDIKYNDWGKEVILGKPEYLIYTIYFLGYYTAAIVIIYKKQFKVAALERDQLKLIFYIFLSSGIFGIVFNLLLPWLGNYQLIWIGPTLSFAYIGSMFYVITRYRIFGISFLVGRLVYFLIITIVLFLTYHLMLFIFSFDFINGPNVTILQIIFAFIFSILFSWLFDFLAKQVNKNFIYADYNPQEELNNAIHSFSRETEIEKLIEIAFKIINENISPFRMGIIIFNKQTLKLNYIKLNNLDSSIKKNYKELLSIAQYWDMAGENKPFLIEEALNNINMSRGKKRHIIQAYIDILKKYQIQYIFALNHRVNLNGMLFISTSNDNSTFSFKDVDFINSLCSILSVGIGRAILFTQVQNFSMQLKHKVEKATLELREKVEQLNEELTKERNLMDILGHELRTPLSLAGNAITMLNIEMEQDNDDKISKNKVIKQTERVTNGLENELKILESIVSSTKIENNQLHLSITKLNINELIINCLETYTPQAKDKSLSLTTNLSNKQFFCIGAKEQLQEVLNNLVENAIKYTQKGSVKINIIKEGQNIYIKITDTGEGIPEEDLPQLGKKFFRSRMHLKSPDNDSRNARPSGTGIGLYVVKGLLSAMNSKLEIKSKVNEGSTFGFYLPISS